MHEGMMGLRDTQTKNRAGILISRIDCVEEGFSVEHACVLTTSNLDGKGIDGMSTSF